MVEYKIWGNNFEEECLQQLYNACSLPVSVRGALMPDGHSGYGLPIGGVLATNNAVIPYGVGVDIACRMSMSVFDMGRSPTSCFLENDLELTEALLLSTKFGVGAEYEYRLDHAVMHEKLWDEIPKLSELKDKAWRQLGTSGSGNHFAEWGILTVTSPDMPLKIGQYVAFLTHGGSRGAGNLAATYYSKLAQEMHPELNELKHLSWFTLDSEIGQEYWQVMELMGRYASANHELIHNGVRDYLKCNPVFHLENHHNFAWKEKHFGMDVIVHRKGATPAASGVMGIIPGSMASPGFVVIGLGNPDSMDSASHGAGRAMSRKKVKKTFNWSQGQEILKKKGVTLISAGLDEIPQGYKDILAVMEAQKDLVEVLAQFDPKIVKMAPGGDKPED